MTCWAWEPSTPGWWDPSTHGRHPLPTLCLTWKEHSPVDPGQQVELALQHEIVVTAHLVREARIQAAPAAFSPWIREVGELPVRVRGRRHSQHDWHLQGLLSPEIKSVVGFAGLIPFVVRMRVGCLWKVCAACSPRLRQLQCRSRVPRNLKCMTADRSRRLCKTRHIGPCYAQNCLDRLSIHALRLGVRGQRP